MKKVITFIFFAILFNIANAQYIEPTWESINARPYPQWFSDAKLGIFIHWGVYSVPAYAGKEGYGEWYYRGLMVQDSNRAAFQKKVYGENFTYYDFDKLFKAEMFKPDEWADLFVNSGAKYVLLVTKHHDGYCLWDSKYAPKWNSVVGGPKRNIVAELTESVRKRNLQMGFYYSLAEWTNPLHIWTVDPPDSIANYVENYMIPQFKELISTYKPTVLFTDGEWDNTAEQWHAKELISWYYNTVGKDAISNDRWGHGNQHGFKTPEYSGGIIETNRPWAECRGLGRSFALNRNEPLSNYITSDQLIRHFVKLVAAGGGMTLNVGPSADGKIPLLQQERLMDLGKWLKINGEAIYGSRPYTKIYEEKDVVVKRVDSEINFNWVRNSPDPIISYDHFTIDWEGFIEVPTTDDYTFEIEVDDAATVVIEGKTVLNFYSQDTEASESNVQDAKTAVIEKNTIRLEKGKRYPIAINYIENTHQASIKLYWSTKTIEKKIIGKESFSNGKNENGLVGIYHCKQPTVCYTTQGDILYAIAVEYPQDQLILNISEPDKNSVVKMLGCDKILPWKFQNGQMMIDTKSIQFNDLQSTAAWVFKITH